MQSMRWHLVFKEEQLKYLNNAFYRIIAGNSPTIASIVKQLNKNRVDKE